MDSDKITIDKDELIELLRHKNERQAKQLMRNDDVINERNCRINKYQKYFGVAMRDLINSLESCQMERIRLEADLITAYRVISDLRGESERPNNEELQCPN